MAQPSRNAYRIRPTLLAAALIALTGAAHGASAPRYRLQVLDGLGGTSSAGASVNDRGWVAGLSNLRGDAGAHAVLWRGGRVDDLGTLGGANSAVLWPVKNVRGIVVGIAQTTEPDPNRERWSCYYFFAGSARAGNRCVGFRWENGVMTELPTLGGTHGFATGANNLGEAVGWAENTVRDPTCAGTQVLQFRAVLWGPRRDQIRELPPLTGDSVSSATAINDRGQVVGISGDCGIAVGGVSGRHNVLWERGGRAERLPDFGGVAWNTPMAINPLGDVVGFANRSAQDGEDFVPQGFLWRRGRPLAKLLYPGDATNQALGINLWRQVVGQSCDAAGTCRGFLWQNGAMYDLDTLLAGSGFDGHVVAGNDIDDFGRITGQAVAADGTLVAFLATPRFDPGH